jgi:hypothetical protein
LILDRYKLVAEEEEHKREAARPPIIASRLAFSTPIYPIDDNDLFISNAEDLPIISRGPPISASTPSTS